ncbi:MAG: glycosyltransferase family 9 protein [Acidobacteria bacterium]|nr:glycosyltransferase family 9 protein [Acidobacteriota bacterium]
MECFLIVRLGSLGDVVHAIPAAAALRRRFPQAHIDWLVEPQYVDLLDLVECLDRRVPIDPRELSRDGVRLLSTLRDLRRPRYDAVIDLQGLMKSALLARLVGATRTIGFPRAHLREPLARIFYTDAPDPGGAAHIIDRNLALLGPLGVTDRRVHFPIRSPHTPAVTAVASRFASGAYAVLNPGAAWPNKRWAPERFGRVASAMHRELGLRSIVLWGPGEQPLAAAVAAASEGAAEPAPPTTIVDVVGIARGARVMLSGDTGPLHVAAAVGTPIVALFGPTRSERNGPWAARDITVSRTSRCACLYERRCRRAAPCIDEIGVDDVIAAVRTRVGESHR